MKRDILHFFQVFFIVVCLGVLTGLAADHFFPTPDMFMSQAAAAEYTTVKPNSYLFRTDGRTPRRPVKSKKKK